MIVFKIMCVKTCFRSRIRKSDNINVMRMRIFGLGIQFFEFLRIRVVQIGDIAGDFIWKESCLDRMEREMEREELTYSAGHWQPSVASGGDFVSVRCPFGTSVGHFVPVIGSLRSRHLYPGDMSKKEF